jgi:MoaA/NifB/PqqE/SkfB family radical SAM enzyme
VNLDDAIDLLEAARAGCPGMEIVEGMPQMWRDAMTDLDPTDARAAIVALVRRSARYIAPADIRAEIRSRAAGDVATTGPNDNHCRRPNCPCDHARCDRGFVYVDGDGRVTPCERCKPEAAAAVRESHDRWDMHRRLQSQGKTGKAW